MIIDFPLGIIILGLLTCSIVWRQLGRDSLARDNCGKLYVGFVNYGDLAKRQKYGREIYSKWSWERDYAIALSLEEFALARIKASHPFSGKRYVFGNLYALLSLMEGPPWMFLLVPLVVMVVMIFYGYVFPVQAGASFIFVIPAYAVAFAGIYPRGTIFLPGGRIEKYHSALASGLLIMLFSTCLLAMLAMVLTLIRPLMPVIPFEGAFIRFHAFDFRESYLHFSLMPIALVYSVFLPGRKFLKNIFPAVIFGAVLGYSTAEVTVLSVIGLPGIIILVAASWIGSVLILRYHFRRRDLVGQGR
jgi:hypothetical protein